MQNEHLSPNHSHITALCTVFTLYGVKQFVCYLSHPVVGAVPGHLAANVEAFQDVERSDQADACMWGRGRHHVVSFRNTNKS